MRKAAGSFTAMSSGEGGGEREAVGDQLCLVDEEDELEKVVRDRGL
jgi:hypothetical protein